MRLLGTIFLILIIVLIISAIKELLVNHPVAFIIGLIIVVLYAKWVSSWGTK